MLQCCCCELESLDGRGWQDGTAYDDEQGTIAIQSHCITFASLPRIATLHVLSNTISNDERNISRLFIVQKKGIELCIWRVPSSNEGRRQDTYPSAGPARKISGHGWLRVSIRRCVERIEGRRSSHTADVVRRTIAREANTTKSPACLCVAAVDPCNPHSPTITFVTTKYRDWERLYAR